jgi:putative transposase
MVGCDHHRRDPAAALQPPDKGERTASVIVPNVLDWQFHAASPNARWIADFTGIWSAEGWLYVAVVIDLFSRRAVGWSMSATMTAQLVTDAFLMAIWRLGRPKVMLRHSDQGSQYTSEQFQRLLQDNGVSCSMSRSGNVWDNAAMESVFSSLKTERTDRTLYRTRPEARADVIDCIECFHNPRRQQSPLGYISPIEFERRAGLASQTVHGTGSRPNILTTRCIRIGPRMVPVLQACRPSA